MKTLPVLRSIFAVLFSLAFAQMGWGQTTIGIHDFETSNASPAMTRSTATTSGSPSVSAVVTGNSPSSSASPTSSPYFTSSNSGYRQAGPSSGTAIVTHTFGAVNTQSYTGVSVSIRVASMSIGSASNGIESDDYCEIAVSPDNGTTWYQQSRLVGGSTGNSRWAFSGTGTVSRSYLANNTLTSHAAPGSGGLLTGTNAITTMTVTGLPSVANLRIRVQTRNDGANESWIIDDVRVAGTLSASAPTVTTGSATSITSTTATLGGEITVTGGSNSTERGIFYSTTDGFANGAGTKVSATGSFGTGTFTQAVTGLSAGTTYYFKAFATNTTGTGYGSQGTFTTTGITPPSLTAAAGATVDAPFTVTFTDDATWRGAITGVTVGGTSLTAGFSVSAGTITFTPSASVPSGLLQSAGTKTISVQATGYSSATVSQAIDTGAATQLVITTQPTAPASNAEALAVQPVVAIRDQYGNTTPSTATVTAAVGAGAWTLGGTTGVAASAGTATFSGLTATATAAVTGATISFTSPGLTSVTSNTFNIPAPAFAIATGGDVTENFDSLGTGTNLATLPAWSHIGALGGSNTTWTNATGIPNSGAQSAATAGTINNTLIVDTDPPATTDNSNTQAYNFALTGSTSNRAIGTSPTTGAGNILQFRILNSTGSGVSAVSVSYDIRRFTAPATANELPGYRLFYSTDSGTTWTNVSALNPALSAATVNVPNTVGVTSVALTAITLSPALPNGSEIRFRWIDDNATETSPDQIIGLDNVVVNFPLPVVAPTVTTTTPATGITPRAEPMRRYVGWSIAPPTASPTAPEPQ